MRTITAHGQRVLVQHLPDAESLEILAREGLSLECVPTEGVRNLVAFSLDYFHQSGQVAAPSETLIKERFGDMLDEAGLSLDDPEDTIHYAISDLKATYAHQQVSKFNRAFAADMAAAEPEERLRVVSDAASELVTLRMTLESRQNRAEIREDVGDRLVAYHARAADRDSIHGIRTGIREIDDYTRGIHEGELGIMAAGPKVGKSFALGRVGLREWQADRTAVLYTLENSVEMTLDRMACMATGVPLRNWNHGECTEAEVERMQEWVEEATASDSSLHVIQPPPGSRGVQALVREAQLLGADSLLIDQLTFLEPRDERAPRHIQIREITHDLKSMISTGHRIPCLMAHQVNREGVKAAQKSGMLSMENLAEGSEVERTVDWVFGLFRSDAERALNLLKWQTLATRREDSKNFLLQWDVNANFADYRCEIDAEGNPISGSTRLERQRAGAGA